MKAFNDVILAVTILVLQVTSAATQEQFIIGTRESLYSKILGEKRELWVSAPKVKDPKAKLPVVFVLDGETHFQAVAAIANMLGGSTGNSLVPDMIIVGVINNDRQRDLTPSRDPDISSPSGGAEAFAVFFEKELIPYISKRYAASENRTLIGHSLGGLFAMYALKQSPVLFKSFVVLDPAMHWHKRALLKGYEQPSTQLATDKKIYLAIAHPIVPTMDSAQAQKDTTNSSEGFRSITKLNSIMQNLSAGGFVYQSKYYPSESHGTVPMPGIYDGLRSVFDFYKRPTFAVLTDRSAGILVNHYKTVSEKIGYTIPPPENIVGGLAWRYRLEKRYDDGLAFLTTLEPAIPNKRFIYLQMAQMLEEKGDSKSAAAYTKKANEAK